MANANSQFVTLSYSLIDGEGHQPRAIIYSRSLEAVGLAQCSDFGLQLWFFAVLLFARRQDYS